MSRSSSRTARYLIWVLPHCRHYRRVRPARPEPALSTQASFLAPTRAVDGRGVCVGVWRAPERSGVSADT